MRRSNSPWREFRSSKGTRLLCIFTLWAMCPRNPQRMWDERGRRQAPPSLHPVGSPCGDGKSSLETLSILQQSCFPNSGGPRPAREAPSPVGGYRGPAISFSEGGGNVWAALCGDESDIGIDVAGTDEFQREYPFHRVFHAQELHHALRSTGGDLGKASALLWSIKEAVVKAMGCAFHLVDPRQITVYPSVRGAAGGGRRVYLSGGLIREGPGAVSHSCRPVLMGAFASSGQDVAFHRPLESATSMRRWAGVL